MTELERKSREYLEQYVLELEQALDRTMANRDDLQKTEYLSRIEFMKIPEQTYSTIRVLIVDDDPDIRTLVTRILNDRSLELLEASSGQHTLAIIEEANPPIDVILLNIKMPGMNGFEVLKSLKDNPKTETIKVIMVSSSNELEEKIRAFETGASDYIVKPFAREELLARINVQAELTKTDKALRASEERYRFLTENVHSMISMADMNGNYVYVNEAHQRILGYSKEELIGNCSEKIIHPDDWDYLAQSFASYIEKGDLFNKSIVCRLITKNGSIKWVEIHGRFLRDDYDNPEAIITIGTDITERKKAQDEAVESRRRIEDTLNSIQVGVIIVDALTHEIQYANPATLSLIGTPEDAICGKICHEFICPDPAGKCPVSDLGHKIDNSERVLIQSDGNRIDVLKTVTPIKLGDRDCFVETIVDISNQKAVENAMAQKVEELQKSEMATLNIMEDLQETISSLEKVEQELNTKNEELIFATTEQASLLNSLEEQNQIIGDAQLELAEALDRAVKSEDEIRLKNEELIAVQSELREINLHLEERVEKRTIEITRLLKQKEDFITQLAHDLRSPLTPLVALMPILRDKQEDPGSLKMADMAVRNIDYMKDLVNQTVQLAKLNSTDAAEFDIHSLNLADVIEALLQTQQYNFTENNIVTYNNVNKEIIVAADKLRLTELLINLATNAIKFMHDGGTLTFDARVDNQYVIISVKDTGIGVTEEQADHIFDEFYKADQSRHDLGSAGLGLSISKRIVEKHGGEIWIESAGLGKGTTFFFSIPLSREEPSN